jgi:hypothetical protein
MIKNRKLKILLTMIVSNIKHYKILYGESLYNLYREED